MSTYFKWTLPALTYSLRLSMRPAPNAYLYTAYLEAATIALYPATSDENECCAGNPMATVRSRKHGAFEFKGVQSGYYWLRVQKNQLTRLIPVHVRSAFNEKVCYVPSVGRSMVVDASPPKIETRIR